MRWCLGLCLLSQCTDSIRLTKSDGRRCENIHRKWKTGKIMWSRWMHAWWFYMSWGHKLGRIKTKTNKEMGAKEKHIAWVRIWKPQVYKVGGNKIYLVSLCCGGPMDDSFCQQVSQSSETLWWHVWHSHLLYNFQRNTNVNLKLLIMVFHTIWMTPGINKVRWIY